MLPSVYELRVEVVAGVRQERQHATVRVSVIFEDSGTRLNSQMYGFPVDCILVEVLDDPCFQKNYEWRIKLINLEGLLTIALRKLSHLKDSRSETGYSKSWSQRKSFSPQIKPLETYQWREFT